MARSFANTVQDRVFGRLKDVVTLLVAFLRAQAPAYVGDDALRQFVGRQRMVHHVRPQCGQRHAIELGGLGLLNEDEPGLCLDLFEADRAIGAGSRQHDRDRQIMALGGKRAEECIDRMMRRVRAITLFGRACVRLPRFIAHYEYAVR